MSEQNIVGQAFQPAMTGRQAGKPAPHLVETGLERRDYLLLAVFCLILFGISTVSGRPLSVHESVLPQSAREMLADGDWVVPKKGGTPWLESPPLPQWITVSLASLFGRLDEVGIARLGPTLMGTVIVLIVAWMASCWFGRTMGLLSGFIMATTCQLTRYAWLAEDEIFLCAVVTATIALFTRLEFTGRQDESRADRGVLRSFLGGRSWLMLAFFVMLGMTNLAKGLLFGTAMVLIPISGFLLWNADLRRISRYVWLWGWLAFAAVMLAWPIAAYLRYPDVLQLWWYDLGGRLDGSYTALSEPIWYYPVNLLWVLAPWTLVVPFGMWVTRQEAFGKRYSPERFLWCWALLVPAVFSLAHGKHHHYLLHALAPWAVLSAFGLLWVRERMLAWPKPLRNPFTSLLTIAIPTCVAVWLLRAKIPGPSWLATAVIVICPFVTVALSWALLHRNNRLAARTLFGTLAVAYCFGHWFAGVYADRHRFDATFLERVKDFVPGEETLLVDMEVEPLRGFFCLFYLADNTIPLHNLSFAVDERIRPENVYVVTQYKKRGKLAEMGTADVLLQSERTGRTHSAEDRLTLFRLKYHEQTPRVSTDGLRISPMQAIYRTAGPSLTRF